MRSQHLKQVGDIWYYQRRRPNEFSDVEPRSLIRFSLKTRSYSEARALAANHSLQLEKSWREAKDLGLSLKSKDEAEQYQAALKVNQDRDLSLTPAQDIPANELVERLLGLLAQPASSDEQRAILGLVDTPKITMGMAFERFWEHIKDEWMVLSADQQRVKRNVYLKSIRNFEKVNRKITLHEIKREHALAFRSFWLKRVEKEGLKPYTGNREINSLRRMVAVNYDIDSIGHQNPFHRVRLRDTEESQRKPFTTEFIQNVLVNPAYLADMKPGLELLVRLLVNTGLRPGEAVGLELADFNMEDNIPHVHVRRNKTRTLKTTHSERMIPLLGVSLEAGRAIVAQGGWGKWLGKNMYATRACGHSS